MQGNENPVNSIWNCTVTVTVEALNVSDQWWIFFPATVNDSSGQASLMKKKTWAGPKKIRAGTKKINT